MTQVTEREVLDRLKTVIDPGKGKDIVSLGMVSGLVVRSGNVGFSIEVAPELGAQMEPLRKAAEDAVHALPGVVSQSPPNQSVRKRLPTQLSTHIV